MNRKGFTLIELLAVIVILAVIMTIAVPNVISTLDRNKKDSYIGDAKKFLSQAKYQISSKINKPAVGEIVKIKLSCVDNEDIDQDPEGNPYDEENSFVVIIRENDELVYYVNLIGKGSNDKNRGIRLTKKSNLDSDDRMKLIEKNITVPTDAEIRTITGVTGGIRTCSN